MAEVNARCAELDAEAVDGTTVVHTSEFFDLMVGSVINSVLIGKRFDETNKDEFLKLKELMHVSAEMFTIFDMTVPVWVLQKFFPKRYELSIKAQTDIVDYVSREAIQRIEDVKAGKYSVDPENPNDFVDAYIARMEQENRNGGHPAYT